MLYFKKQFIASEGELTIGWPFMLKEVFNSERFSVCRIGGEEFAIVMPDTPLEHAIELGETALERIRKEIILFQDKKIQFTSSMGLASLINNESIENWMKRTDTALYESKKEGRDRLTVSRHLSNSSQVA